MSVSIHEIPNGSVAMCSVEPRNCPVRCHEYIARRADGSFEPAVRLDHPTLRGWNGARFDVLAENLTEADIDLFRAVSARWALRSASPPEGAPVDLGDFFHPSALVDVLAKLRPPAQIQAQYEAILASVASSAIAVGPGAANITEET